MQPRILPLQTVQFAGKQNGLAAGVLAAQLDQFVNVGFRPECIVGDDPDPLTSVNRHRLDRNHLTCGRVRGFLPQGPSANLAVIGGIRAMGIMPAEADAARTCDGRSVRKESYPVGAGPGVSGPCGWIFDAKIKLVCMIAILARCLWYSDT